MLNHSAAGRVRLARTRPLSALNDADCGRLLFLARYSMGFRSEALREKSRC
jgi:hypothetical protein